MKIQYNKTKTATTIISALVIGLIMLSPMTVLPNVNAQQNLTTGIPDRSCIDKIDQSMHSEASLIDKGKAQSLATSNSAFKNMTDGYTVKLNGISNKYSIDSTNCTATLESTNVDFILSDSTGSVKHVAVVQEDKAISKVTRVTEQEPIYHSNQYPSTNWSGYELYGASTPYSVPVYEAYASWNAPSVSPPSSGCSFTHCDLSIWPGLVANPGGGSGSNSYIAQAGTDSGVYCTVGCSYYYSAWWEFFPNPSNTCMNVNPSDSITTDVYSQAKSGGNPSLYNISIMDFTTNTSCGTTNYNFSQMGTPYFADFINERPSFGGTPARLPQFTSDSITSYMYSNGFQSIWNPYSNGWFNQYTMNNGQGNNISVGAVGGLNGPFTETWLTSAGT